MAQSPDRVTAWFGRELDTRRSSLEVYDAAGYLMEGALGGVDLNDLDHASMIVRLPAPLPAGTYSVRWRAVDSVDGDATEGAFTFTVGRGGGDRAHRSASAGGPTGGGPQEGERAPAPSGVNQTQPPERINGQDVPTVKPPPAPPTQPQSESGEAWPIGWIAAGLAGLVLAATALGLGRLARRRGALGR